MLYLPELRKRVTSTYRLAPQLKTRLSGFYKALKPLANAYAQAAGFRQVGLRYDDILIEEREDVQKVSRDPVKSRMDVWPHRRRCVAGRHCALCGKVMVEEDTWI